MKPLLRCKQESAATPERLTLMESWEKIYLCAIKEDESAIRRRISQHVKLCNGSTSIEAVNETLYRMKNEPGGYAAALNRVRNATNKILGVTA